MHLNGENFDLKKKLTPGVALSQPWGYIHVYYHSDQTSKLVYIYLRFQVSVYRTIGPLVFRKQLVQESGLGDLIELL